MTTVIRIMNNKKGESYLRIEDGNKEVLMITESYDSATNAKRAAAKLAERFGKGSSDIVIKDRSTDV